MQTLPETVLLMLAKFFAMRQTLPARCIQAFFLVAEEEGLTVSEYARRAGMSRTSMSRNIADLTARNRSKTDGHALLLKRESVDNLCERHIYLSDKGKQLLADVKQIMEGYRANGLPLQGAPDRGLVRRVRSLAKLRRDVSDSDRSRRSG
jgi:DNA-binding MarR family transcriptional regulator